MPVHNADIARLFSLLADLLEIEGANPFRVRAYRNAARTIESLPHNVEAMVREGADLSELPGIGEDLAGKIKEIVETGRLTALEEVKARIPASLADLIAIPGLGPKRVNVLYRELGITDFDGLARAAKAGQLRTLPGFGAKIEEKILQELDRRAMTGTRMKLITAEQFAEPLLGYLRATPGVTRAIIAGSYRRRKETIGDIDILITCQDSHPVMERFVAYDEVEQVLSKGKTRSTVVLRSGLQVDLRVVAEDSYGSALQYFTGSKAHNIAVRSIAVKLGLKLNEYGVFRGETYIAGRTEEDVYRAIGLPYIEPELREDWGEIEAAQQGRLPHLVTVADIRGDLHAHTKATDGHASIEDMAEAAKAKGYEYLAITDHTKRVTVANGMDATRMAQQIELIDRLNERLQGITILKSAEVDILEDGSLDLPDDILKQLDLTVCSIHYKLNLSREKQTERVIRAMDNPYFTIFGHPSGRMIGEREPYAIDMERVMEAALERGCVLEVNAQPARLDLTDTHCKMAKDMGVKVVISTDAHRTTDLDFMRFGVDQARRGWLEPSDVLNTRTWPELKRLITRR